MWKVWKFTVLMLGVLGIAAIIGLLVAGNSAYATPSPSDRDDRAISGPQRHSSSNCSTCHMPVKADFLNTYGLALRDAQMKFEEIETA